MITPNTLALGYLLNQNMISNKTKIDKVEYYDDLMTVVVRTKKPVNYQKKLKKKNNNLWMCSRYFVWRYNGKF